MNHLHRVLVIDDEEGIQQTIQEFLIFEGYDVRAACDGKAGLDIIAGWQPEAIILDLKMPVMDGTAFRAAQRRLTDGCSAIPVILLSGSRDTAAQAMALGADATVRKPFDLDELLSAVEQTIAHHPAPTDYPC